MPDISSLTPTPQHPIATPDTLSETSERYLALLGSDAPSSALASVKAGNTNRLNLQITSNNSPNRICCWLCWLNDIRIAFHFMRNSLPHIHPTCMLCPCCCQAELPNMLVLPAACSLWLQTLLCSMLDCSITNTSASSRMCPNLNSSTFPKRGYLYGPRRPCLRRSAYTVPCDVNTYTLTDHDLQAHVGRSGTRKTGVPVYNRRSLPMSDAQES